MSTRICRDCKYRMDIANTEETGAAICSKPISWFVVNIDDSCHFIPKKRRYTCYDCLSYGNDPGCLGMRPDEEPYWGEDENLCHVLKRDTLKSSMISLQPGIWKAEFKDLFDYWNQLRKEDE